MGRVTNEMRIHEAWDQTEQEWPPTLGDKLRVFVPKSLRGRVGKVIAVGDDKTRNSTRRAPGDKARVLVKDAYGERHQFAVDQFDVFPKDCTLKQLLSMEVEA